MKNWLAGGVVAGACVLALGGATIGAQGGDDNHCQDGGVWKPVPEHFVGERIPTTDGWRIVTNDWCFENRGWSSTLSSPSGATWRS